MQTKMSSNQILSSNKLPTLQFIFTVITALITGIYGYFIHEAQQENNKAQIEIKQQQVDMQKEQNAWQKEFQKIQNNAQQKQLEWQTNFQKLQLESQERVAQKISKLNAITAMNPFIDKIVDSSPIKARLAAYGLYLLNQEDPEMAVTLIAATKRQEMNEVFKTLGKMKPDTVEFMDKFFRPTPSDEVGDNKDQVKYSNMLQSMQTATGGYCFFGRYVDNKWAKKAMVAKVPIGLPKPGEEYSVIRKTYLRASFPVIEKNELELGKILGVNRIGNKIKILDVKHYPDGAVWCRLEMEIGE